MNIVAEHVKTGAGRRQQHGIAGIGQALRLRDRIGQAASRIRVDAAAGNGGRDQWRITADQHHCAGIGCDRRLERTEILPLAVAAQNHHCLACSQPIQCRFGRADVGAFRVVVIRHPLDFGDFLHPVRQSLEVQQSAQQGFHRQTQCAGQRQGRQRVGRVMQPRDREHGQRHQHVAAEAEFVLAQTEILALWAAVQPETHHMASRSRHGKAACIVTVHHLHALAVKDVRLGRGVGLHVGIAIHMVFRHIEDRGGIRIEASGRFELKTGQFQHPHLRCRRRSLFDFIQGIQHRQANIAGDTGGQAGDAAHVAAHRGDGALAVAAGDRNHPHRPIRGRRGGTLGIDRVNGAREQFDIPRHFDARGHRTGNGRFGQRHAGAHDQHVSRLQLSVVEGAGKERHLRQPFRQMCRPRRHRAAVGHADPRPARRQPARARHSGVAEAEHENILAGKFEAVVVHLSFRLDNPISISIIEMIQNRTTT